MHKCKTNAVLIDLRDNRCLDDVYPSEWIWRAVIGCNEVTRLAWLDEDGYEEEYDITGLVQTVWL